MSKQWVCLTILHGGTPWIKCSRAPKILDWQFRRWSPDYACDQSIKHLRNRNGLVA